MNDKEFTPEDLAPYAGSHSVVRHMLDQGIPLTRENYLTQAYLGDEPSADEWNYEHEAALPEPFQDFSSVIPED